MKEGIPPDGAVLLTAAGTAGLEALKPTREILSAFGIAWTESVTAVANVPSLNLEGIRAVIVAAADAALPGAFASGTDRPVVRVPVAEGSATGLTLLHDPATADLLVAEASFATVAIGEAGAKNAALFIVSVLALDDPRLRTEWLAFRQRQTDAVLGSAPLSTD